MLLNKAPQFVYEVVENMMTSINKFLGTFWYLQLVLTVIGVSTFVRRFVLPFACETTEAHAPLQRAYKLPST